MTRNTINAHLNNAQLRLVVRSRISVNRPGTDVALPLSGYLEVIRSFELGLALFAGWIELAEASKSASPVLLPAAIGYNFLLERGLTLIGHTTSRALIYIALRQKWLLPALLTFLTFSIADGVAQYGELAHWWDSGDTKIVMRYQILNAVLTALEIGAVWFFAKRMAERRRQLEPIT